MNIQLYFIFDIFKVDKFIAGKSLNNETTNNVTKTNESSRELYLVKNNIIMHINTILKNS